MAVRTHAARSSVPEIQGGSVAPALSTVALPPRMHHHFERIAVTAPVQRGAGVVQLNGGGKKKKGGGAPKKKGGDDKKDDATPAALTDEELRAKAEAFVAAQGLKHNPKSGASGTPAARRAKWHAASVQEYIDKWKQNFDKDKKDKGGAGGGIAAGGGMAAAN